MVPPKCNNILRQMTNDLAGHEVLTELMAGIWCRGRIAVSNAVGEGSSPSVPVR